MVLAWNSRTLYKEGVKVGGAKLAKNIIKHSAICFPIRMWPERGNRIAHAGFLTRKVKNNYCQGFFLERINDGSALCFCFTLLNYLLLLFSLGIMSSLYYYVLLKIFNRYGDTTGERRRSDN